MDKLSISAEQTKKNSSIKVAYLKNGQWHMVDKIPSSRASYWNGYRYQVAYTINNEKDVKRVIAAVVKKYGVNETDCRIVKATTAPIVEYDVYSEQDIKAIANQRAQEKARKTIQALRNKIDKEKAKLHQAKVRLLATKK